jgi:hypothetical protein
VLLVLYFMMPFRNYNAKNSTLCTSITESCKTKGLGSKTVVFSVATEIVVLRGFPNKITNTIENVNVNVD